MKKNKIEKLTITFVIFFIFFCLFCISFFKVDPDYLWHIKAGQYMLKHGVLTHDVFSWSAYGKYWMSHEWLFEVIIAFLHKIFGKFSVFLYLFAGCLSLIFFLFLTNKKKYLKNPLFLIFWATLFIMITFSMQVRPHIFSYLFLAIAVYSLYSLYENEDSKKIYFLPLLSILWSNFHGGSSNLPYLLCLVFIIGGLFNFKFSKIYSKRISKKQLIKYLVVMVLCMIAVCINIHGFKMFIYPYQNMMNKAMIENIMEWQPTTLNSVASYVYFALLLFIFGVMLFSKKKILFLDFLLFGFCAFLGLKSVRFWFFTYIIMSYVVFNYVESLDDEIDNLIIIAIGILSFSFIVLFSLKANNLFNFKYEFLLEKKDIEYIKKLDAKRMFNIYDHGGELIYNDIKVFVDGRADLYSDHDIFNEYLTMVNLDGGYSYYLNKYDFDYFVVSDNYRIYMYLLENDNYKLIYTNKSVHIFRKEISTMIIS